MLLLFMVDRNLTKQWPEIRVNSGKPSTREAPTVDRRLIGNDDNQQNSCQQ